MNTKDDTVTTSLMTSSIAFRTTNIVILIHKKMVLVRPINQLISHNRPNLVHPAHTDDIIKWHNTVLLYSSYNTHIILKKSIKERKIDNVFTLVFFPRSVRATSERTATSMHLRLTSFVLSVARSKLMALHRMRRTWIWSNKTVLHNSCLH